MVDILTVSVVLLCTILLLLLWFAVLRYWPSKKYKEIYSVAFKMSEAPQTPKTVETRPQLLSLSDADEDIVFQIDDEES